MSDTASWVGSPAIKGSSEPVQMLLLTFSLLGLQFTWGIEQTYCTPYLLQLGLSKSATSLVWVAGPLSGLIMQPLVGAFADRSKSKYGRRRPIMISGSIIVAIGLLVLGWTRELMSLFVSDEDARKRPTVILAVIAIYVVDFSINAVQSCCRSLIVDTLPVRKQQLGSAWASRLVSVGHFIGYALGTVKLSSIFGNVLGNTQFKRLCVVSAFSLLLAVGVTSYSVTERVLLSEGSSSLTGGLAKTTRRIVKTTFNLPDRMKAVCYITFWAWIGWFPFLFYSTTWVGETFYRYSPDAPDISKSPDALGDIARVGSMSLVLFSLVSLTGSLLMPWIVRSPDEEESDEPGSNAFLRTLLDLRERTMRYQPGLLTVWTIGHLMFSASMILAPFVRGYTFATILVTICGIPWALTCWAPFSVMGEEINQLSIRGGKDQYSSLPDDDEEAEERSVRLSSDYIQEDVIHVAHDTTPNHSSTGELAGLYLGVLNIFTTLPQFIGTLISTIVFAILEPGQSPELSPDMPDEHHPVRAVNAIAVCLAIGSLSTLVAAQRTWKLRNA